MNDHLKGIIKDFAKQYHLDWRILFAILMNESNAQGFDKSGKLKERFEKHIYTGFKQVFEGQRKKNPHLPGLTTEWIRSHNLQQLEYLSTSYGIAQIMGWQYPLLGYSSIDNMVQSWRDSEEIQIRDFCLFCVKYNNGKFLKALKQLNILSISAQYNGTGYAKNNYDNKLIKHYKEAK